MRSNALRFSNYGTMNQHLNDVPAASLRTIATHRHDGMTMGARLTFTPILLLSFLLHTGSGDAKPLFLYKCSDQKVIYGLLTGEETGIPYTGNDVGNLIGRFGHFYTAITAAGSTTSITVTGGDLNDDGTILSGFPDDVIEDDFVNIQIFPKTKPNEIQLRVWSIGMDKATPLQSSACVRGAP